MQRVFGSGGALLRVGSGATLAAGDAGVAAHGGELAYSGAFFSDIVSAYLDAAQASGAIAPSWVELTSLTDETETLAAGLTCNRMVDGRYGEASQRSRAAPSLRQQGADVEGLIEFIESNVLTLVNQIIERETSGSVQAQRICTILLQFGEENPGMVRVGRRCAGLRV